MPHRPANEAARAPNGRTGARSAWATSRPRSAARGRPRRCEARRWPPQPQCGQRRRPAGLSKSPQWRPPGRARSQCSGGPPS
eukprot:15073480-Alexandrium_andersonii.AAC.1